MKNSVCGLGLGAATLLLIVLTVRTGLAPAGDTPKKGAEPSNKQVAELRAEIKKLEQLAPDQAAIMTHVAYHWSNLWFAVDQENWPLAEFYLSETRNNLKWAVRSKPFRDTASGKIDLGSILEAIDNTQLKQFKEAIGKKEKARSVQLYDETLTFCYACHKSSEKPYLRPQRPTAPETRIINFDPNAKDPK
jgi:hypothetical protein